MTKPCSKCGSTAPRRTLKSGRLHSHCRTCESIARAERKLLKTTTKAAQILRAQKARLDSDTEALQPGDFAAGALNDGRKDASADKEKKQEYSRSDGEFLQLLRASGGNPAKMPPLDADKNAYYLAVKSEQERRFRNRQLARYEAVHSANESLNLRNLMSMAKEYFTNKTTPAGYALKHVRTDHPRTNIILLSDLHFGADMFIRDNPQAFGAEHESRRFGEVI